MDRDDLVERVCSVMRPIYGCDDDATFIRCEINDPGSCSCRISARAALAIIEPAVREDLLSSACPFDRAANNLEPEDPCPVCGDLGTFTDDAPPSRCITRHTRAKP